jgi:hypothetical protein
MKKHSQMTAHPKALNPMTLIQGILGMFETVGSNHTLISLSFAKLPKEAIILGTAAAKVSWTDSSGLLLVRVRHGRRFTR